VEQRCASLLVLGALKIGSAATVRSAGALLDESNPVLKDYALRYFEETRPKPAAPLLLKLLDDPDKEAQERAVRLLSGLGTAAVAPLLKQTAAASRLWQLNAARILSAGKTKGAWQGLLRMLLAGTDDFNRAVCDCMAAAIRALNADEREPLYREVEAFARALGDAERQRPALVSAIRLTGEFGRPESRRWLLQWIDAGRPPVVRSHALVALLRCLREQELRKDEHARLLPLLEEPEYSESTRLALEILDGRDLPGDCRPLLSRLLQSAHPEVQKFALRKMAAFSTPATVRTLIDQLGDPDYRRRDVAAASLRKMAEARPALIQSLLACEDASKAWSIAELLATLEGRWRQDALDALWQRLQTAILAEDRIQGAFLHVLKKADSGEIYRRLSTHGARLLKAKKYKEALPFLTLLKEFPEHMPEDRFALGLAHLKLHSPAIGNQRQHPAIEILADLYRNPTFPLLETLKKEKSLTSEEFFALGFSLAERPGEERHLGRDLLGVVAARSPRTKIGKSAKNKLKLLDG
jgi:HEAT repeat protein